MDSVKVKEKSGNKEGRNQRIIRKEGIRIIRKEGIRE